MIVIYIIITVLNWAFHYYCCYYYITFFSFSFEYSIFFIFCLHKTLFFCIICEKKVFCMDIEKNHQRQVEYTIITWDLFSRFLIHTVHISLLRCRSWLSSSPGSGPRMKRVRAFLCEKIAEKMGGSTCIFFLFILYTHMSFILKIVSMIKHDHFILLFFFVFIIVIKNIYDFAFCVRNAGIDSAWLYFRSIATDVLHVANNFLVTFACLLFFLRLYLPKYFNDQMIANIVPVFLAVFCWYFKFHA